jgi:hypothetical protein
MDMNPTGRAIVGTPIAHAGDPAPGTNQDAPDVLFICGADFYPDEEVYRDTLRRESDAYGVTNVFLTPGASDDRTVFAMLDDLHAGNRVGPYTTIVVVMHGSPHEGQHTMVFSKDQAPVSTMALLEHIARLDGGIEDTSSQRSCIVHSCSMGAVTPAVKEMHGNYFLIGGKSISMHNPGIDAVTEILRQMGSAKKQPQESEARRLTAGQTSGHLAAAAGTTVSHAGNGQVVQSKARRHADFKNPAIKPFEPDQEKRAADAIVHLLFKKNDDKLKRLLDEVPAAKAALTSPARNLMQTALSCGSPGRYGF